MANDLERTAREIDTRLSTFLRAIRGGGSSAPRREGQEHYRAQQYLEAARGVVVDKVA